MTCFFIRSSPSSGDPAGWRGGGLPVRNRARIVSFGRLLPKSWGKDAKFLFFVFCHSAVLSPAKPIPILEKYYAG